MSADTDRVTRLTEAQREVLRHFHERQTAKEIGRHLGITHWAVNERLRSARRALGVATSGEAARLLAACDKEQTYNRIVCDPEPVAAPCKHVMFSGCDEGGEEPSEVSRHSTVREERLSYQVAYRRPFRLPLPRYRGERNDLSIRARLMWIGALALAIVASLGALVTIASGAMRMFAQLYRALA